FVDNGNGTATLAGTPAASAGGVYHLTISATNGVGVAATQDLTLNVVIATPPKVLRLQRFGTRPRATRIVLSFDEPMDPARAELTSNYVFRRVVRGHPLNGPRQRIGVTSAVYDPVKHTVTLQPAKRLSLLQVYQIRVYGMAPSGLANIS